MVATLVEQLPGDQALYSINDERTILPGQWLSNSEQPNNEQCYAIFHSSEKITQFVADNSETLPETFNVSGEPLSLPDEDSSLLLLADNQASPLIFFLLNHLRHQWGEKLLRRRVYQILLGSDQAFPFPPVPSRFLIPGIPTGTIASSQLLEDLALPARLASLNDLPGCFPGSLSDLLNQITFDNFQSNELSIVAIGSSNLLATTKKLFAELANKQFLIKFENK